MNRPIPSPNKPWKISNLHVTAQEM